MSLSRLRSAFLVAIICSIGCQSSSPFKLFSGRESAKESSQVAQAEPAPTLTKPEEAVAMNESSHTVSRSLSDSETRLAPEAVTLEPSTENSVATADVSPEVASDTGPSEASTNDVAANAIEPQRPTKNPRSEEQQTYPVKLASSGTSSFPGLRFAIPGTAKAREDAVAKQIADFEKYPFDFQLPTVAGETVDSKHFKGQLMVIDVWATWCAPCKRAIPDFVEIQKEFESQGVQVIGITCDSDDPADAADTARKAYAIGQQLNINYPLLVDDGRTKGKIPGFRGYPTTLFMTPDGTVRYQVTGAQSKEKLAAMVKAILQH